MSFDPSVPNPVDRVPTSPREVTDPDAVPRSGFAVTGFVLAFFIPLAGLLFSLFARADIRKGTRTGAGIASWGVALSATFLALQIVALLILTAVTVAAIVSMPDVINEVTTGFTPDAPVPDVPAPDVVVPDGNPPVPVFPVAP